MLLRIRNLRVYYEISGGGEPLLLLHGGFGTVQDFASQTPVLAKHFKVVAFERPGHGHTADTAEPFSFDTMSGYTVDFIDALKLGATNLIGWSDGAIIALLVAISRPDLVKSLVCVSGLFDTNAQSPEDLNWIRSLSPESFRKAASPLVKRYDQVSPDGPAHFPAVVEKTKRLWLNEPNITTKDLARISAPTMVMAGDRDSIPIEHTLELFKLIKGAQLCIIPGTTHFLMTQKPDMVNRAILEFLTMETKPKSYRLGRQIGACRRLVDYSVSGRGCLASPFFLCRATFLQHSSWKNMEAVSGTKLGTEKWTLPFARR